MPLTKEQGEELVRLARSTVDGFVRGEDIGGAEIRAEPFLKEVRGAFVTLKTVDGSLRGCIGFPYPVKELGEAVVEAAISAAAYDPRFPKVEPEELEGLLIEVSALTKPVKIERASPRDLPKHVKIGVDGLIVSNAITSGLLLPQVATEYKLTPEDFLSDTCLKAGLSADSWLDESVTVQKFQAEIFSETAPRGRVKKQPD
jgi:uncharacterized protein